MSIKENGNGIGRLMNEVDDLNLIITQLEEEMKVLGRGQQRQITQQQTEEGSPWTLTIHNGWLRIETGIRNISDLLNSQPIRYLSPRISTDQSNQDLVVHFNIGKTMRLRMLAMKLLVKCLNPKPNPTALLLPTSFLFNASVIIDTLVDRYFECYNFLRPFVHQPTFMKYYKELNSPLDSLLTLCICCVVCAAPCDHLPNSYQELRCMGDYFAGLAKSKILEQFDVPEKRLENVMAINMLGEYLYTVLNVSESLKLVSMGFQICHDLKPWYDKESKKPGVPSVECMLFSRHFPTMIRYNRLSDVIINRTQQLESVVYMEWLFLPDESDSIIDSVLAQNWHYQLTSHPVMAKIRVNNRYIYMHETYIHVHMCVLTGMSIALQAPFIRRLYSLFKIHRYYPG
jgi:hypothetical protein